MGSAILLGDIESVRLFLHAGLNVNKRGFDNKTALHFAAQRQHKEIVSLLLEQKGIKFLADNYGKTPQDYGNGL